MVGRSRPLSTSKHSVSFALFFSNPLILNQIIIGHFRTRFVFPRKSEAFPSQYCTQLESRLQTNPAGISLGVCDHCVRMWATSAHARQGDPYYRELYVESIITLEVHIEYKTYQSPAVSRTAPEIPVALGSAPGLSGLLPGLRPYSR